MSRRLFIALLGTYVWLIGSQVVRLTEPDHSWLNVLLLVLGCAGLVMVFVGWRKQAWGEKK